MKSWVDIFKTKFKNVIVSPHFIDRSLHRDLSVDELNYMMKKLDKRLDLIKQTKSDSKLFKVDSDNEWEFKWQFKNYKSPKDSKYFRDIVGSVSIDKTTLKFISLLTPNKDTIARDKQNTTNRLIIEKINEEVIDDRFRFDDGKYRTHINKI